VLQFILSELLDVPASVESGTPNGSKMNFYNPQNHEFEVELVSPQYKVALGNAQRLKDCAKARTNSNSNPGADGADAEHELCAHFVAEIWDTRIVMDMVKSGLIESPQGLGALGQEGWFVPRMTAEKDPSQVSYIGLGGEENRKSWRLFSSDPPHGKTTVNKCHSTTAQCRIVSQKEHPKTKRKMPACLWKIYIQVTFDLRKRMTAS
jgi:hypothetical protein